MVLLKSPAIAVFVLVILAGPPSIMAQLPCHGGGGTAAAGGSPRPQGPIGASSTGKFTQVYGNTDWIFEPLDSVGLLFDFLGRYSRGFAPGGKESDPLGTGGQNFASESAPSGALYKANGAPDKLGYLPLWPSSIVSGRIDGRIAESWKISSSLYYSPAADSNADDSDAWGVGELFATWVPSRFKGLALKGGRFASSGSYYPIFDQDILGAASLQGIGIRYAKRSGNIGSESEILLGLNPFLSENRQYGIVKTRLIYRDGYQGRVFGGIQLSNADSVSGLPNDHLFRGKRLGWHAGIEALHRGNRFSHKLAFTHGRGDVLLGFGAPSWVRFKSFAKDSSEIDRDFYSRNKSAISNLACTAGFSAGNFSLESGLWGIVNAPFGQDILDTNNNAGIPASFLAENGLPAGDTIRLSPEAFSSAKFSILPSFQLKPWVRIGLRYAYLRFLDPRAKANWQSIQADQTLHPLSYAPDSRFLYGPAQWEWEGVNAHIISPHIEMNLGDWLHLSIAYTEGFYDEKILRQGRVDDQHSNVSLVLMANYHFFRKLDKNVSQSSAQQNQ